MFKPAEDDHAKYWLVTRVWRKLRTGAQTGVGQRCDWRVSSHIRLCVVDLVKASQGEWPIRDAVREFAQELDDVR